MLSAFFVHTMCLHATIQMGTGERLPRDGAPGRVALSRQVGAEGGMGGGGARIADLGIQAEQTISFHFKMSQKCVTCLTHGTQTTKHEKGAIRCTCHCTQRFNGTMQTLMGSDHGTLTF